MAGNKEQRQFYFVFILAAGVLAISVWAFVQGIQMPVQEQIVQTEMAGGDAGQEEEQQEQKEDAVDTKALAETALAEISFETDLERMKDTVAESMITVDNENTKIELYMGEGTCSDELLIVIVPETGSVKKEVENVQRHLTEMQQSFEDYLPKEAKKIDDAVILQTRNYIVACVSSDKDQAKKVIEKQLQ